MKYIVLAFETILVTGMLYACVLMIDRILTEGIKKLKGGK